MVNGQEVQINKGYELYQIITDFGEPLEIIREAIQNSFDENASYALYPRAVQRHFLKTVFCNKTELHSVKHSTKDNYIGITLMV